MRRERKDHEYEREKKSREGITYMSPPRESQREREKNQYIDVSYSNKGR